MKYVSSEYKASMKKSTRNKTYMKLSMGLINQEAQQNAEVLDQGFTPYSDTKAPLLDGKEGKHYASYEENWSAVDGSVYFLPRSGSNYFQQGIATEKLLEDAPEGYYHIQHSRSRGSKGHKPSIFGPLLSNKAENHNE